MNLGLKRGTVSLQEYDPSWADLFKDEKKSLATVFGEDSSIEHVGSTAIPGSVAKPIIDMCVEIDSLAEYKRYLPALISLGYIFMPDRVYEDEIFIPKGLEHQRTYYLHIVEKESQKSADYLSFRNRLRASLDLIQEYNSLKIELSKKYAGNREAYTKRKTDFIKKVLA